MVRLVALVLCLGLSCAVAEELHANPIRKVVTMLQDMQKTVEAEGEKEKELFDKFMCYCNNGAGSIDASIETATAQIASLTGKIDTESAQKSQMQQDVTQHKADRTAAKATIQESTTMREKEAAEFDASSGEMKANIEAMGGALAALKKGLSASLLQTSTGQTLKNILQHSPLVDADDRSSLLAFLQNGDTEGGSDQIIGIVSQMKETMEGDLKESTTNEESAKASFTSLMTSKEEEIVAAGKAVEEKTVRVGDLAVSVATAKADLEDTQDAQAEDEKLKANLATSCATKSKEWDERSSLRSQEVQAISETIEMLNGDDALELFKKTLPSAAASFLQLATTARSQQRRATTILRRLMSKDPAHAMNLRTILLGLKSGSQAGGFGQVTKMIDDMIATHAKDQADEDAKRDFCLAEIAKTEDEEKALKGAIADLDADIDKKEDAVASLVSEISALQKGIETLDKSVVEATEQRKDEHSEYTSTAASNQAAMELIAMAKNRMNKFYQPSLYKAPPTTTVEDSPYGFVQLSMHTKRADPGPAPETFKGEYKKSGASTGVIAMMDQMVKDVDMDIKEAKMDEASAQKDYEEAMKDAAAKRAKDSKSIVEKQSAKADEQTNLESTRAERSNKNDQLRITQGKSDDLHIDCDYLTGNYEEMKKNRATEVDGLKQSKSVLMGAAPGAV
jgi:hypothetical protein